MPPVQRGHARKLPSGRWQLRYYDEHGQRHTGGAFKSKSEALTHYRKMIEPRLNGEPSLGAHGGGHRPRRGKRRNSKYAQD